MSALVATLPVYGATDADLATPIRFSIAREDATAVITTDIPGNQSVQTQADGLTTDVIWTPDALLTPDTDYHLSMSWCDGEAALDFHSIALGTAPDATTLPGKSWAILLQDAHVVQPAEAGDAVVEQLVMPGILLSVLSIDGDTIKIRAGMSTEYAATGPQNWCVQTLDFEGDYRYAPWFVVEAPELSVPVNGEVATIRNLRVTGMFAADDSSIEHATLWGLVDLRQGSASTGYTPDELCQQVMPQLGVYCEPCDDDQKYCVTLGFDQITAPEAGAALDAVPGLNCAECATAAPEPDAVCEG